MWGSWEFTQIAFANDDYRMANVYSTWLEPAKDPGDDLLCAIKFDCLDIVPLPFINAVLKDLAGLLEKDYGVQICTVQMPQNPNPGQHVLNVRRRRLGERTLHRTAELVAKLNYFARLTPRIFFRKTPFFGHIRLDSIPRPRSRGCFRYRWR